MEIRTRLIHPGSETDPHTGAAAVPIYQASTFSQPSLDQPGAYDYARSGNPTRAALEQAVAALEGGLRGFAFASGMAAISTVLMLLDSGDHVVVTGDCYGGTHRVVTRVFNRLGIQTTFADTSETSALRDALRPNTRLVLVETLSNPFLKVTDLRAAVEIAHRQGALLAVDNTFLSPVLCRPLELGADIVLHSATKYMGGHSDLIAGVAAVRDADLGQRLYFLQNAVGAVLGPQDCFLLMRGLKTMGVRMQEQQAAALAVATFLAGHPAVAAVYYPGLAQDPGHGLASAQGGFGGVLSFRLRDPARLRPFLAALRLPALGVSLGAVETIITVPAYHSHAAVPPDQRAARGITDDLLRLSVGLEAPADLISDLEQALQG